MSQNFADVAAILAAFKEANVHDADIARIASNTEDLGRLADFVKMISAERRVKNRKLGSIRNLSIDEMAEELPEIATRLKEAGFRRVFDLTAHHRAQFAILMLDQNEMRQVIEWLTARGLKIGVQVIE